MAAVAVLPSSTRQSFSSLMCAESTLCSQVILTTSNADVFPLRQSGAEHLAPPLICSPLAWRCGMPTTSSSSSLVDALPVVRILLSFSLWCCSCCPCCCRSSSSTTSSTSSSWSVGPHLIRAACSAYISIQTPGSFFSRTFCPALFFLLCILRVVLASAAFKVPSSRREATRHNPPAPWSSLRSVPSTPLLTPPSHCQSGKSAPVGKMPRYVPSFAGMLLAVLLFAAFFLMAGLVGAFLRCLPFVSVLLTWSFRSCWLVRKNCVNATSFGYSPSSFPSVSSSDGAFGSWSATHQSGDHSSSCSFLNTGRSICYSPALIPPSSSFLPTLSKTIERLGFIVRAVTLAVIALCLSLCDDTLPSNSLNSAPSSVNLVPPSSLLRSLSAPILRADAVITQASTSAEEDLRAAGHSATRLLRARKSLAESLKISDLRKNESRAATPASRSGGGRLLARSSVLGHNVYLRVDFHGKNGAYIERTLAASVAFKRALGLDIVAMAPGYVASTFEESYVVASEFFYAVEKLTLFDDAVKTTGGGRAIARQSTSLSPRSTSSSLPSHTSLRQDVRAKNADLEAAASVGQRSTDGEQRTQRAVFKAAVTPRFLEEIVILLQLRLQTVFLRWDSPITASTGDTTEANFSFGNTKRMYNTLGASTGMSDHLQMLQTFKTGLTFSVVLVGAPGTPGAPGGPGGPGGPAVSENGTGAVNDDGAASGGTPSTAIIALIAAGSFLVIIALICATVLAVYLLNRTGGKKHHGDSHDHGLEMGSHGDNVSGGSVSLQMPNFGPAPHHQLEVHHAAAAPPAETRPGSDIPIHLLATKDHRATQQLAAKDAALVNAPNSKNATAAAFHGVAPATTSSARKLASGSAAAANGPAMHPGWVADDDDEEFEDEEEYEDEHELDDHDDENEEAGAGAGDRRLRQWLLEARAAGTASPLAATVESANGANTASSTTQHSVGASVKTHLTKSKTNAGVVVEVPVSTVFGESLPQQNQRMSRTSGVSSGGNQTPTSLPGNQLRQNVSGQTDLSHGVASGNFWHNESHTTNPLSGISAIGGPHTSPSPLSPLAHDGIVSQHHQQNIGRATHPLHPVFNGTSTDPQSLRHPAAVAARPPPERPGPFAVPTAVIGQAPAAAAPRASVTDRAMNSTPAEQRGSRQHRGAGVIADDGSSARDSDDSGVVVRGPTEAEEASGAIDLKAILRKGHDPALSPERKLCDESSRPDGETVEEDEEEEEEFEDEAEEEDETEEEEEEEEGEEEDEAASRLATSAESLKLPGRSGRVVPPQEQLSVDGPTATAALSRAPVNEGTDINQRIKELVDLRQAGSAAVALSSTQSAMKAPPRAQPLSPASSGTESWPGDTVEVTAVPSAPSSDTLPSKTSDLSDGLKEARGWKGKTRRAAVGSDEGSADSTEQVGAGGKFHRSSPISSPLSPPEGPGDVENCRAPASTKEAVPASIVTNPAAINGEETPEASPQEQAPNDVQPGRSSPDGVDAKSGGVAAGRTSGSVPARTRSLERKAIAALVGSSFEMPCRDGSGGDCGVEKAEGSSPGLPLNLPIGVSFERPSPTVATAAGGDGRRHSTNPLDDDDDDDDDVASEEEGNDPGDDPLSPGGAMRTAAGAPPSANQQPSRRRPSQLQLASHRESSPLGHAGESDLHYHDSGEHDDENPLSPGGGHRTHMGSASRHTNADEQRKVSLSKASPADPLHAGPDDEEAEGDTLFAPQQRVAVGSSFELPAAPPASVSSGHAVLPLVAGCASASPAVSNPLEVDTSNPLVDQDQIKRLALTLPQSRQRPTRSSVSAVTSTPELQSQPALCSHQHELSHRETTSGSETASCALVDDLPQLPPVSSTVTPTSAQRRLRAGEDLGVGGPLSESDTMIDEVVQLQQQQVSSPPVLTGRMGRHAGAGALPDPTIVPQGRQMSDTSSEASSSRRRDSALDPLATSPLSPDRHLPKPAFEQSAQSRIRDDGSTSVLVARARARQQREHDGNDPHDLPQGDENENENAPEQIHLAADDDDSDDGDGARLQSNSFVEAHLPPFHASHRPSPSMLGSMISGSLNSAVGSNMSPPTGRPVKASPQTHHASLHSPGVGPPPERTGPTSLARTNDRSPATQLPPTVPPRQAKPTGRPGSQNPQSQNPNSTSAQNRFVPLSGPNAVTASTVGASPSSAESLMMLISPPTATSASAGLPEHTVGSTPSLPPPPSIDGAEDVSGAVASRRQSGRASVTDPTVRLRRPKPKRSSIPSDGLATDRDPRLSMQSLQSLTALTVSGDGDGLRPSAGSGLRTPTEPSPAAAGKTVIEHNVSDPQSSTLNATDNTAPKPKPKAKRGRRTTPRAVRISSTTATNGRPQLHPPGPNGPASQSSAPANPAGPAPPANEASGGGRTAQGAAGGVVRSCSLSGDDGHDVRRLGGAPTIIRSFSLSGEDGGQQQQEEMLRGPTNRNSNSISPRVVRSFSLSGERDAPVSPAQPSPQQGGDTVLSPRVVRSFSISEVLETDPLGASRSSSTNRTPSMPRALSSSRIPLHMPPSMATSGSGVGAHGTSTNGGLVITGADECSTSDVFGVPAPPATHAQQPGPVTANGGDQTYPAGHQFQLPREAVDGSQEPNATGDDQKLLSPRATEEQRKLSMTATVLELPPPTPVEAKQFDYHPSSRGHSALRKGNSTSRSPSANGTAKSSVSASGGGAPTLPNAFGIISSSGAGQSSSVDRVGLDSFDTRVMMPCVVVSTRAEDGTEQFALRSAMKRKTAGSVSPTRPPAKGAEEDTRVDIKALLRSGGKAQDDDED